MCLCPSLLLSHCEARSLFCVNGDVEHMLQIEAGVDGYSPGPATERYLTRTMRVTRFWGAFLVATLAIAAQYFDGMCMKTMETSLGSVSLLLVVGLITSCIRQVYSKTLNSTDTGHCR